MVIMFILDTAITDVNAFLGLGFTIWYSCLTMRRSVIEENSILGK